MNWDRHAKFRLGAMEQPGMAAGLMVNVKTASEERANLILRFEDGKFFRHLQG